MLMFYCYFVGVYSRPAVTFMILQSAPTYKEQLVDYYGVAILLNIRNLAFRAVFYCLYGCVPLFKKYKKRHTRQMFLHDWHYLPLEPPLLL